MLLPIGITLLATAYLIYLLSKVDYAQVATITLTSHLVSILLLAVGTVFIRDAAYVYRMWELNDRKLSISKCIEIIFLWEFGSSVTPASFGGVSMAFLILYKEGIKPGKATSILMLCSYLDNIAFVIVFGTLYLILGHHMFDLSATCGSLDQLSAVKAFRSVGEYVWIGFLAVAMSGMILGFSLFIRPQYAVSFLNKIAQIKFINRWEKQIHHISVDILHTSIEFQNKGTGFVIKLLIGTTISWCARYALANVLIYGFASGLFDNLDVFARQYVHRVIVIIPATPGGSGIAELSFMALNCEFIKDGLAPIVTLIWRGFNFYFYIIVGIVILPKWLARVGKI